MQTMELQAHRLHYVRDSGKAPLVSIIIPTFRRDDYLFEALSSALLQTPAGVEVEILVVDNDPDSLGPVLERVRQTGSPHQLRYYINSKNLGMFGNWNQGILLARGRWVTLLHDDDWLYPGFVAEVLPVAETGADLVVCRVAIGEEGYANDRPLPVKGNGRRARITIDDLIFGNISPAPGVLARRNLFFERGGFEALHYPVSDYLTYISWVQGSRAIVLNRTLAYYRTTDSQTFKEDTLEKMIRQSLSIKHALLQQAPRLSVLTYVLSASDWFTLAGSRRIEVRGLQYDWKLRAASRLSRWRGLWLILFAIRRAVKIMTRVLSRPN